MGSLPNLSELGREIHIVSTYKLGSLIGQSQHGNAMLSYEERNRILHRHSGYCRNSKIKANAQANIVYDDFMLEQMAAYSPISSRSTRNLTHNIRRRDSMNSSIGATSVRRLIAVVRNTNSRCGPVYSRKILIKNLMILCISHTLVTSTYLPFLALQGSVSIWIAPLRNEMISININVGSVLLMILHMFAALSVIVGPSLVQKVGANAILITSYVGFSVFYALHLFPILYVLVPGYILLGIVLGPVSIARVTFLMTLSAKLSYIFSEDDEESKIRRRTCIVRRISRAFQAAHDFGFIFGSIVSAAVITYSFGLREGSYNASSVEGFHYAGNLSLGGADNQTDLNYGTNCTDCACNRYLESDRQAQYDYNTFLDGIFDEDEVGERLCGANACPSDFPLTLNGSCQMSLSVLPKSTATVLIGVYVALSVIAVVCAVIGLDKIRMFVHQDPLERSEGLAAIRAVKESFKDVRLQMAAPLAFFIGLEQAFMYADFSKSYVVCTLGIHRLNLVFLCMGLLQSIAACTLSMLLRNIRRYYLIAVGFMFHTCLLMVQMLWKPIGDDPALFYVISAAWGVCNAIWEMLNYTLLTGVYMDSWEAAFANATVFKFLGLAVAFGIHGLFCNWLKLYLLAFFMVAAIIPFAWLEIKLENIKKIKNISRL